MPDLTTQISSSFLKYDIIFEFLYEIHKTNQISLSGYLMTKFDLYKLLRL